MTAPHTKQAAPAEYTKLQHCATASSGNPETGVRQRFLNICPEWDLFRAKVIKQAGKHWTFCNR